MLFNFATLAFTGLDTILGPYISPPVTVKKSNVLNEFTTTWFVVDKAIALVIKGWSPDTFKPDKVPVIVGAVVSLILIVWVQLVVCKIVFSPASLISLLFGSAYSVIV